MPNDQVAEKLKTLPTKPGVYQYFDATGKVIYVGKAINLRNRVRSYFHASGDHTPNTLRLVVFDIDDEHSNGRGYSCRDPEGHVWNFGTYDPWKRQLAPAGGSSCGRRARCSATSAPRAS